MGVIEGKTVYQGMAVGEIYVIREKNATVERYEIQDAEDEIRRLMQAIERTKAQLCKLKETAEKNLGTEQAAIFEGQEMMLEDEVLLGAVKNSIVSKKNNAESAVSETAATYMKIFEDMDDEYMRARGADVLDVAGRLIDNLLNKGNNLWDDLEKPVIVVANDLMPGQTINMDRKKILAFVTAAGSKTSHTAILAKAMGIPAIVGTGININELHDGMVAIVDAYDGKVILEPTEKEIIDAENKADVQAQKQERLKKLIGMESKTTDGREIGIMANIGSTGDIEMVIANDAGGVGLFRSEFLYLEKDKLPTEEEQYNAYKEVVSAFSEKKVIIRTLDIGADKNVSYIDMEDEENPAMGMRGIRLCINKKDIFVTQLKALLRAAVHGNLEIMYPMITSTDELIKVNQILCSAVKELKAEGKEYKIVKQGIMIETPAAALISDELADMVDFFSIGTNDLTQYTLALDRQNSKLDEFYNPYHKSVLRMIELVVKNAHDKGKKVSVCGELAADEGLTEYFVDIGVDELSVSPLEVLKIRDRVRRI